MSVCKNIKLFEFFFVDKYNLFWLC